MSIKYQIQNNEISSLLAGEVCVTTVFNNYVQGLDLLYMQKSHSNGWGSVDGNTPFDIKKLV